MTSVISRLLLGVFFVNFSLDQAAFAQEILPDMRNEPIRVSNDLTIKDLSKATCSDLGYEESEKANPLLRDLEQGDVIVLRKHIVTSTPTFAHSGSRTLYVSAGTAIWDGSDLVEKYYDVVNGACDIKTVLRYSTKAMIPAGEDGNEHDIPEMTLFKIGGMSQRVLHVAQADLEPRSHVSGSIESARNR